MFGRKKNMHKNPYLILNARLIRDGEDITTLKVRMEKEEGAEQDGKGGWGRIPINNILQHGGQGARAHSPCPGLYHSLKRSTQVIGT